MTELDVDVELSPTPQLEADLEGPVLFGATGPAGPTGPTGPAGAAGVGVPVGGTTGQALTKTSNTDYATGWSTIAAGTSLTALHSALLATKVWSTGSSAYVWPGDGTAPDANSYTNITFIDPTGTHNPASSTGGRSVANDLWETGVPAAGGAVATDAIWDTKGDLAVATGADTASKLAAGTNGYVLTADSAQSTGLKWAAAAGGGGALANQGEFAASTSYAAGDVVTYGGHHFTRLSSGFTSGSTFDPSNWLALDPLTVDNPGAWTAANAADQEFSATTSSLPSGWAWTNQGSSTYAEAYGAGVVSVPAASGDNLRIIDRSLPSASSWLITAKVAFTQVHQPYTHAGLVFRDSSGGKILSYGVQNDGTVAMLKTLLAIWASSAGSATIITAFPGPSIVTYLYLRVRKNSSTSYDFEFSIDGVSWLRQNSAYNPSTLTMDRFGFYGCPSNASYPTAIGCHWIRYR